MASSRWLGLPWPFPSISWGNATLLQELFRPQDRACAHFCGMRSQTGTSEAADAPLLCFYTSALVQPLFGLHFIELQSGIAKNPFSYVCLQIT